MIKSPPSNPTANSNTFVDVALKAEDDFREFLLACTTPAHEIFADLEPRLQTISDWKNVYNGVKKIAPGFPVCSDILHFLEEVLPWLDERKHAKPIEAPWELDPRGRGKLIIEQNTGIPTLLDILKDEFLDNLCMPCRDAVPGQQDSIEKIFDYVTKDRILFKKFVEFAGLDCRVDSSKPWTIKIVGLGPNEGPLMSSRFISWLVVGDGDTIYIVFNKEVIKSVARNNEHAHSCLEKVLLHELGHAVVNLPWYEKRLISRSATDDYFMGSAPRSMGKWIGTPAWHESEAWAYAFTVRGCIKSVRSWITRLVSEIDKEWRNL